VLRKLPPEQLLEPHSAVYAAVILLDENDAEGAKQYIAEAKEGPIYPEEKKLLEEALAKAAAIPPLPAPAPNESVAPPPAALPPAVTPTGVPMPIAAPTPTPLPTAAPTPMAEHPLAAPAGTP
jgi:hypothetical protein